MDKIQVGVIRLVIFVHRELSLLSPGKNVHHPAVCAVGRRNSPGHRKELEVALRVFGNRVEQLLIDAEAYLLPGQRHVQRRPLYLFSAPYRRVDQQPGRQAVLGQKDVYLGVQVGQ